MLLSTYKEKRKSEHLNTVCHNKKRFNDVHVRCPYEASFTWKENVIDIQRRSYKQYKYITYLAPDKAMKIFHAPTKQYSTYPFKISKI